MKHWRNKSGYRLYCGFLLLLICLQGGEAQQTAFYDKPELLYRDGLELFAKAKYAAASKQFSRALALSKQDDEYLRSEASYYRVVCGAKLYHRNADVDMRKFIATYTQSNRIPSARLALADYLYYYKRYEEAYKEYQEIDPGELNAEQNLDYLFHSGYAAFSVKRYEEAKLALHQLTEEETKYRVVAIYYYAYILYTEGKYQNALNEFEKIETDPVFSALIPYFVLQIYYMQERYEEVIQMGPDLLEKSTAKRAPEVARLIGEAYYYQREYTKALPYMELYFERSSQTPDQDGCYTLGYIFYEKGVYDTAAHHFLRVLSLDPQNELAQSSFYHLGYCYVKMGKKKFAMDAFRDASRLNFNPVVKEDAMYNYVKLSYDLGLAPYRESVSAFEQFLAEYPNSVYQKKIYEYMLQMYMRTKNYEEALGSLDKIRPLTTALMEAKQTLLLNRGIEQYHMRQYLKASQSFRASMDVGYSEAVTNRACFWAGETAYKMGDVDSAYKFFQSFVNRSESSAPEYALGFYNLGYTQLDKVLYGDAYKSFARFLELKKSGDSIYETDALLRAGDAAFMQRLFGQAEEYYRRVIKKGQEPLDYAHYQVALCEGAIGAYQKKVDGLLKLVENYPRTEYMVMALNELAATYLVLENNEKSLLYYKRIQESYPRSNLARLAMLKIGLIYFNMGQTEKALTNFQHLASEYPSSQEARQALVSIRNIYITLNRVDEFFAYAKSLPQGQVQEGEQDSITYMAAEARYMEGDCVAASQGLKTYIERFPQGYFMTPAWFYLAECAYQNKQDSLAGEAYLKVASFPACEFTDKAIKRAAGFCYKSGRYEEALRLYKQMLTLQIPGTESEALIGRMRCFYRLGQDKNTIDAAQSYLKRDKISNQEADEARYYVAQVSVKTGDESLARQMYTELLNSIDPRIQSEARYYMIEKRMAHGELNAAEKLIFDYLSNAPGDDYYLAKVYMLWADIYEQRGNMLQAKQTLKSIMDNYEGEGGLVQMAKQKYEAIEATEKADLELEQRERAERYAEEEEIIIPEM